MLHWIESHCIEEKSKVHHWRRLGVINLRFITHLIFRELIALTVPDDNVPHNRSRTVFTGQGYESRVCKEQYSCMNIEIFHYPALDWLACLDWHRLEVRWIVKQFQRFLFYIRSPLISLVSLHTFAMRVSTADGSLNCRIKRSLRLFLGFTLLGFALSSRALVLGIANLSSPKGLRGEKEGRRWMVCKIKQVRGFSFKFLAKKWSGCLWREREGRC